MAWRYLHHKIISGPEETDNIYIPKIASTNELLSWISTVEAGIRYWDLYLYWSESPYEIVNHIDKHYTTFYVPKRSGLKRRIDKPDEHLKTIQKWILEKILYGIPCSKYAKAYIKGRTINDNVRYHKGQKIVVTLDIKDFFGSVKGHHIYQIFKQCEYPEQVAVLLTKLCLFNDCLPQGAPTSAYLSNLVLNEFDKNVGDYCFEKGIRYTRYADDMTFSGDFDITALIFKVDSELCRVGLKRNPNKVKIMRQNNRQKATGVVLNDKIQASREYRLKIRQEIHYIKRFGLLSHLEHIGRSNEKDKYLHQLLGKISYVLSINRNDKKMAEYKKYITALITVTSF